jgi:hypothetical protein
MGKVLLHINQEFITSICSNCKLEFLTFLVSRGGIYGIHWINGKTFDHCDEWVYNLSCADDVRCPKCGELINGKSQV